MSTITATVPQQPLFLDRLSKLRDVLELLGLLRDLREPLASPDGLHGVIEVLLGLAEMLGIDAAWIARLRKLADDPRLFEILLAVARYVASLLASPATAR